MKLELDKELLERIAKSTDKEWLSHMQSDYYSNACASLRYSIWSNNWQKDYDEGIAYGNACYVRLLKLRRAEEENNK